MRDTSTMKRNSCLNVQFKNFFQLLNIPKCLATVGTFSLPYDRYNVDTIIGDGNANDVFSLAKA